jgi:ribosomal protein S18 acetylase RimI-like enzyme/diadenosine tetraphosphate (Ap4A) HIT family hydrolase
VNIAIRPWTLKDAESIYRILRETWLAAYSSFIPEKDILEYLDAHYHPGVLKNFINEPETHGYVAEADGVPAGYMRLKSDGKESKFLISQLYVLPEYQKNGIGKKLMQTAAQDAAEAGLDRLWIGVMVQNDASVRWYRSFGYRIDAVEPFTMGQTTVEHYIGFIDLIRTGGEYVFRPEVHVPAKRIFSVYARGSDKTLDARCGDLYATQRTLWKQIDAAAESLRDVQTKKIQCSGFDVSVQENNIRLASTSARIDPVSIEQRPCFLCPGQLPPEQLCILWRDAFLILCNPAPIFRPHFTVVSKAHIPQEIASHTADLLDLARDVSPSFTVFYNGPKCGASAPDHLHFQMSPRRAMISELDAVDPGRRVLLRYRDHLSAFTLKKYGRAVLILESTDRGNLEEYFSGLIDTWKAMSGISDEPKMNILCSYQEQVWRMIVFPRKKHRTASYGQSTADQILISPGAVDMAGLFITPRMEDFTRMNSSLAESIYAEVAEEEGFVERLIRCRGI